MAPTVFRTHKVRFVIYANDHAPPHLHVIKGDFEAEARIEHNSLKVMSNRGFTAAALRVLQSEVSHRQNKFLEVWNEVQRETKEND